MKNKHFLIILGIAAGLHISAIPAAAENSSGISEPIAGSGASSLSPIGVWHKRIGTTKFEIFRCGLAHCGKIVYLSNPVDPQTGKPRTDSENPNRKKRNLPLIGVTVLRNMVPVGQNRYKGKVYNPEDGRTYSGNLTQINSNQLKLGGCVLGGLICKNEKLVRVK